MHLLSGQTLSEYGVDDEDVAKRWLELIAPLLDWNQDMATLQAHYSSDLQDQTTAAMNQAYDEIYGDPDELYDEEEM